MAKNILNIAIIGCSPAMGQIHMAGIQGLEGIRIYAVCDTARDDRLMECKEKFGAESIIRSVFGINNRALTQKEKDFAVLWVKEWGFNAEIIRMAYDINVNAKGKFTFPYISKILETWHQKGLHTVDAIRADQENRQTGNNVVSSFDTKEIDNIILDDYM